MVAVLLWGLLPGARAHAEAVCIDTSSSAASGTLTDSGGSGGSYSNSETCGFLIDGGGGAVTLSFSSFSYESGYDFLRVYDGTSTAGTLLGSFTGSSLPGDLTASSGAMYVVSDTDFSVRAAGFVATWSMGPAGPFSGSMCTASGSTASSGSLTDSGGASGSYANGENCGFLIAPGGGAVTLSFSSFNYESGYDFLRVYDGSSSSAPLLGSFTGSSLPSAVTAESGAMYIVSDTDGSVVRAGFRAQWSVGAAPTCAAETVADNFPSVSYSLNAGTQDWLASWQEIGESDGPSSGISRVNSNLCTAGNCLRIGEPNTTRTWSNRGASRAVNLSGATSATLSFNYYTGRNRGSMTVVLAISDDGGSSWSTLRTYNINSTNFSANPESFDISAYVSANTQIRFISSANSAVIGMYIDDITIRYQPSCLPAAAVAEWRFDETAWSGAADQVTDSSGAGLDGTAIGALNTISTGQICRAASFDGVDDRVAVTGLDSLLNGTATLSFWMLGTQLGDDTPWLAPGLTGVEETSGEDDVFWGYLTSSGRIGIGAGDDPRALSSTVVSDGNWHHIVLTRDQTSGVVNVFVDGVLEDTETSAAGVIGNPFDSLGVIRDTASSDDYLNAVVDEVVVFDEVLSEAAVQLIYSNQLAGLNWDGSTRDCPVSSVTGFVVAHDTSGIFCLAEPVTLAAVDPSATVVPAYAGQVTLDSQSGRGSWSLASGNGTLTDAVADDGLATYQFAVGDNGTVDLLLSYPEGAASIDIDVFETADSNVRDDDSEGALLFAPSGFTVTGAPLANPPPAVIAAPLLAQVAGTAFPVYITAYGTTPTDPDCGVIETYQGSFNLKHWLVRNNPLGGTLTASIDGQAIAVSEAAATAQSVSFSGGQASVSMRYKDAGNITLQLKDDATYAHTLRGASNAFVVRPARLAVTAVETLAAVANPGAADMSGAGFVPSGQNFRVTVRALDSDGDVTPNFGLETTAEQITLASTGLVAPAGGRHGSAGDISGGATLARTSGGTFQSSTIAFDEVGIIRLQATLRDGDYLGAGTVPGTESGNVGRFYPAQLTLAASSVTPACNGFTYQGEPAIGLSYTLQALNSLGAVVQNYDTALLGAGNVAAVARVAEDNNAGADLGSRLSAGTAVWRLGNLIETDVTARFARLGVPDGPFDALQIGLRAIDPRDNLAIAGADLLASAAGDCVAAGTCNARAIGAPLAIRYGRLTVLPGSASELENLNVSLLAQYFDGTGFRPNAADQCSLYQDTAASLSSYEGALAAGETNVLGPAAATALQAGAANAGAPLLLQAPGVGNTGSALLTLSVPTWLQYDWAGTGLINPSGRQHFGLFRGHDRVVFWGERLR